MAKEKKQKQANKEPGRIKQMVQVYRSTKKHDRNLPFVLLLCFIAPIALSAVLAWLLGGTLLSWILWPITGVLVGLLLAMIVLGRRAERTAYRQIAGQPGAVGAVVQSALRRSWRGSETPVTVNRNQDAVYRVVGRGGVVLIGEGPKQRTKRLIAEEKRRILPVLQNVTITELYVGPDADSVPLDRLSRTLLKLKPTLRRHEVAAVHNRLMSLKQAPIGIPKGIDPNKVRPQRPR